MIFNSINYFLFLLIVFIVYYLLPGKFRWILLLFASILFYLIGGGAKTIAVPIAIIISTFFCGILIEKTADANRRHIYYLAGVLLNVLLLMFFKYVNFFIQSAFDLLGIFKGTKSESHIALQHAPIVLQIIVPLGISYITFQAIGYLIEVKRKAYSPEKNLGLFATYLMFFPKLLSGPIEPAQNFLSQLQVEHDFNYLQVVKGLKRILWGLFLKLVVANRLELYTEAVFGNYYHHTGTTLLVGALFYTIQMFADFAGYTDMAIGSAQVLGFKLIENFNTPFIAKSVSEFWRRWHISLSSWVNEYIYNPIAVSLRSWNKWAVVVACMITFLILGFWHGPNWNYIVFGFLQGVILSIELFTRKSRKKLRSKIPAWLNSIAGVTFTFGYFCFSLIFFRNVNLHDALMILKKIFTNRGPVYYENPSMIIFSLFAIVLVLTAEIKKEYYGNSFSFFNNKKWLVRNFSYAVLVILILLIGVFDGGQFIYFKF
jgi:alginate O-acetyltransferase complex protein AlgI